tara:strand:- start:2092 stop:2559 length:468 start_codon:yes stop_codon:yes gene_type:complete
MRNNYKITFQLIILLCMSFISTVQAEQKKVFDGPDGSEYEVHYIGFTSTFLDPDVAKQYDLVRSRALGVVNISVIKVDKEGKRKPVGAVLQTKMSNDIQQSQFLSFQQIVEGPAIYYIAQLQFREGEMLTFDVSVYPEGSVKPLQFRFVQSFYNN